jgi:GrpB-like predicted nucleotidyltransferase (UPF0157 family)
MTDNKNTDYLNRRVIIASYDANWPHMFMSEKENILKVTSDRNVIVEHIGSTAIPGLSAKPIIDIMVGVKDLATADACIIPLEKISYEYVKTLEKEFPRRRYLHKGPNLPNKHFHVHVVEVKSDFWNKQLFFRDYLRKNPKTLAAYQRLKENLAKRFKDDVFKYCKAKSNFILEVLTMRTQPNTTIDFYPHIE